MIKCFARGKVPFIVIPGVFEKFFVVEFADVFDTHNCIGCCERVEMGL